MTFFKHFLADFGTHFDSKFGPNILKMVNFPNESYLFLLERYAKPLMLIVYLISYHNCRKLLQKYLALDFLAVFDFNFAPKFCPNAPKIFFD